MMLLEITKAQLKAIIDMTEHLNSMSGNGEDDVFKDDEKKIRLVNKMLENNGLKKDKNR